ncbi:MAG: hypothetical protein DRI48_07325, partial [Chloroflexi bacterium]
MCSFASALQRATKTLVDHFSIQTDTTEAVIRQVVSDLQDTVWPTAAFYLFDTAREYELLIVQPQESSQPVGDWIHAIRNNMKSDPISLSGPKGRRWSVVPIATRGEIRALWALEQPEEGNDETVFYSLQLLGQFMVAGHVLERHNVNARVVSTIERTRAILYSVNHVSPGNELRYLLSTLRALEEDRLAIRSVTLWLPRERIQETNLVLHASIGWPSPKERVELRSGEGLVGWCFAAQDMGIRVSEQSKDLAEVEVWQMQEAKCYAAIALPEFAGVLAVAADKPWTKGDLELLESVVPGVHSVLEWTRVRDETFRVLGEIQNANDPYT